MLSGLVGSVSAGTVNENQTSSSITGTTIASLLAAATGRRLPQSHRSGQYGRRSPGIPRSTTRVLEPPVGIAVTGVNDTNGTWEYIPQNGGSSWVSFPSTTSPTTAVVLEGYSNTGVGSVGQIPSTDAIRFVPNPGFSGTSTFTFLAWDETNGLAPITG